MLYVPFLAEINVKKCNKGTINVLQGGGSVEYGQKPYFYIFCGPFSNGLCLYFKHK